MTVITSDFVCIISSCSTLSADFTRSQSNLTLPTKSLSILVRNAFQILYDSWLTDTIGQRHDVVIHANQTSGNYWLRLATGGCARAPTHRPAQMGAILHYEDANDAEPTTTGVTMRTGCEDETNLVPFVYNEVPADIMPQEPLDVASVQDATTENLFRWTIDGSTFRVDWNQPSLKTVLEGSIEYGNNTNVYEIKTKNNVSSPRIYSSDN